MIKIGIIGYGNMGQAIAERIKHKYTVCVFDKVKSTASENITVALNPVELVKQSEIVILAVKPQDFESLLVSIKDSVTPDKIIISIAAGITTLYIQKYLAKCRVVRVMPNLPAKIGKAISCLCKGKQAYKKDLDLAKKIFDYMGKTQVINNEAMMDDVTAVSGSGPGFFYDYLEKQKIGYSNLNSEISNDFEHSLAKALMDLKNKWSIRSAQTLAHATMAGSIALLKASGLTPAELKKQVTSKGGTTEAGLKVFKGKLENLSKAVNAAAKRAKELSKE